MWRAGVGALQAWQRFPLRQGPNGLRFVALASVALSACASAPIQWAPEAEFEVEIHDNLAQQRFDVRLTSRASAPLCLPRESWPDAAGLPAGFDGATLTTRSGTHEPLPTGSAFCPGGCGQVRVEPGQSINGAIGYAAFGDAAAIAADDARALVFGVHPYRCR